MYYSGAHSFPERQSVAQRGDTGRVLGSGVGAARKIVIWDKTDTSGGCSRVTGRNWSDWSIRGDVSRRDALGSAALSTRGWGLDLVSRWVVRGC